MGRRKKEQTYIKSIRVKKDHKDFLESLENANDFLVLQIENSKEFQKFLIDKQDQDLSKYPPLPLE